MADPVFQAYSSFTNNGGTPVSSQTVTFATVNAGDLVLAVVQGEDQNQITGVTLGGSQALTLLKRHDSSENNFYCDVWGVIANSSGSNVNVVASYSGSSWWRSMVAGRWNNVNSATPTQSSCGTATC